MNDEISLTPIITVGLGDYDFVFFLDLDIYCAVRMAEDRTIN